MEHIFELTIKKELPNGKSINLTAFRSGTDHGNACKRFLCENDMKGREIIGVQDTGVLGYRR